MSEQDKDPKEGEEKDPSGNGQPEKKDTEEKVEISKSELETLQKKSKDFEGLADRLKSKERAGRVLPGAEPVKKEKEPSDEDGDDELKEEFITKKDFQKQIEKSAIKEASKNPEVDENWDSIVEYYNARHGKETVEDILADIEIARKTWKAQQPTPKEPKKDEEDKTSVSDLAKDAGLGKGADKNPKPEKKTLIPKKEKMSEWYGK